MDMFNTDFITYVTTVTFYAQRCNLNSTRNPLFDIEREAQGHKSPNRQRRQESWADGSLDESFLSLPTTSCRSCPALDRDKCRSQQVVVSPAHCALDWITPGRSVRWHLYSSSNPAHTGGSLSWFFLSWFFPLVLFVNVGSRGWSS